MTATQPHSAVVMDRDMVWQAIDKERRSLADLFDDLTSAQWKFPSLCAGWRVRDVAAHLTLAHMGLFPGILATLRARGDADRMIHDTAVRQAELPVGQYAVLLRGMAGSRKKAPGITYLEPLIDVLVHGQDIAIPLGRRHDMPPEASAIAASRVWSMRWPPPFPAKRKMEGFRLTATDTSWSVGEGPYVEAPIGAILLASTGRLAALPLLSGPGAPDLTARLGPPLPT